MKLFFLMRLLYWSLSSSSIHHNILISSGVLLGFLASLRHHRTSCRSSSPHSIGACSGNGWYGGNDVVKEAALPFKVEGFETSNKLPKLVDCGLDGGPMFALFGSRVLASRHRFQCLGLHG